MFNKIDLIAEIENLLEEYDYYALDRQDEEYPWELLVFSRIENGEFTIRNFLIWQEFLEPIDWEDFVSDFELDITIYENTFPIMVEQYENFLEFIQNNLQNIQIYKLKLYGINEEMEEDRELGDAFCLIGLVDNEYWLGLTSELDNEYHYGVCPASLSIKLPNNIEQIVSQLYSNFRESFDFLNRAIDSYAYGYKIEVINDENKIIEKILNSGRYCWTKNFTVELANLIDPQLSRLLLDNLLDVKQHKVWGYDGLFNYIGGMTNDGDWIGLYTRQAYSY